MEFDILRIGFVREDGVANASSSESNLFKMFAHKIVKIEEVEIGEEPEPVWVELDDGFDKNVSGYIRSHPYPGFNPFDVAGTHVKNVMEWVLAFAAAFNLRLPSFTDTTDANLSYKERLLKVMERWDPVQHDAWSYVWLKISTDANT